MGKNSSLAMDHLPENERPFQFHVSHCQGELAQQVNFFLSTSGFRERNGEIFKDQSERRGSSWSPWLCDDLGRVRGLCGDEKVKSGALWLKLFPWRVNEAET